MVTSPTPTVDPRLKDKFWRLNHLYKIVDEFTKLITFQLNYAQTHFHQNKHKKNVILKSRRLGFTTYSIIDMLDNTLYHRNWNSLFISYDDSSAKKVFDETAMLAWNHFPFKGDFQVDSSNANTLKLDPGDLTNSIIEVKSSGRGGRTNHIHVSELGKIAAKYPQKAKEIFTGTIPSLTPDGLLTIESTAEGEGDFHDLFWHAYPASQNPNYQYKNHEFKAHFYNWQWDINRINYTVKIPDDNLPKDFLDYQKKHNEKAKKMPHLYQPITDIQLTYWYYMFISVNHKWSRLLQEFPTTPEEAFVHSGSKLFDSQALEKQKEFVTNPIIQNNWEIFEEAKINHTYIMAADPSEGVGQDHSAIVILDMTPSRPKVVATFQDNHIPPDLLAYELKNKAIRYNYPLIMVERNNTGHATITQLKLIYPPELIYKEEKFDKEENQQTERLGWHTNLVTKPRMFYDLSTAINDTLIEIPSIKLHTELRLYDKNLLQKNTPDPETTNHFDLLTALAIAFQGRTQVTIASTQVTTHNIHNQPANTSYNQQFDPYSAI